MADETYEITMNGTLAGQFVQTVQHVQATIATPVNPFASALLIAQDISTNGVLDAWLNILPGTYVITSLSVKKVSGTGGPTAILTSAALSGTTGQRDAAISSAQVNPVIVWIPTTSPDKTGRVFLPGVAEEDIDDMVKHSKSETLLKMIENAKEVEDAGVEGNKAGRTGVDQGVRIGNEEHDAGSAGTANHGNNQWHESTDRGNQTDADGGSVNERPAEHHDDAGAMGGTGMRVSTGNGTSETGSHRRDTGSSSNAQTTRSVPVDTLVGDAEQLHDEDGIVPPTDIPFQFLGFDESGYYFLKKTQNVPIKVGRPDSAMKQMIHDLASDDWWMTWPQFVSTSKEGFDYLNTTAVLEWLRIGSTRKGMFNNEKLLGTGAYKDGDGTVVNTGYAIVTPAGDVSRFEEYEGKLAFVRSPVELVVTATPWTVEDGRFFYNQLKTFGFDQPLAYYAVAGWCAIAPFSAFLFRRPHIWITAKRGMGKTFLIDQIISPLIGEDYVFYTDGSTEAGIRQSLYRDNRPVIMDEFEANKKYDMDTLERILELSRSAYGGKKKVKGSSSQKAISFTLKVMFCFASINVNISNDADRSRIAVCRMTEWIGKMKSIPNPDGLRARMFQKLDEINPNILACHAMMEDAGYEYRTADTYSPLLAGLWMILSDARFPVSLDAVASLSAPDRRLYDHLVAALPQTAQTEEKRPDEERILEEIFQTRLKLEGGVEKTVAEMLTTLDAMQKIAYDDEVQRFGLKRCKDRDGVEILAVVHDSKELKAMLKETPFGGSYKEVLKRNPAYMETRQIHVAKQQMSCIVLRWKDIEERYFKERPDDDPVPF